jgi:diguanylate cyclase (GGDEF)-like protein
MRNALLKHFCKIFLTGLLFIFASFSLDAAEKKTASKSFSAPLTIAIHESSYPYHFLDEQNQADGLMVDFWRLWAKKQQVEVEFVPLPWLKTLDDVANGEVDIHAGLSITQNRKERFVFSQPLFPLYNQLYLNIELGSIEDINELKPYLIGVVKGSAHIETLKKSFPFLKQKMYFTRHELYEAALNKEILVFTGLEKISSNYKYYRQLRDMYPPYRRLRYQQTDYGVSVAKNNKVLLSFINEGVTKISSEERAVIERKWLGIDTQSDSILIAFSPDYPPYSALSPAGNPQGLLIDFWRLWAKKNGLKVEFIAQDIVNSLTLLDNKSVDILLAFPDEWVGSDKYEFTSPIYRFHAKMYVSSRLKDAQSISFFENKDNQDGETRNSIIGVWQYSPFRKQIVAQHPHLNLQVFPTISAMIQASEFGEIDAIIASVDIMNLQLTKVNLQSEFYLLDAPVFTSRLSSLIDKSNHKLLETINEGFEQVAIKDLVKLEERWLKDEDSYYRNLLVKVTLSEQEELFVSQTKEIKVGVLNSLEPTAFYNEKGVFVGIDRDILNLVSKRTGLNFSYQGYDSWLELYNSMLSNELDIITSIEATESRKSDLSFTMPYWKTPWVILHPQHLGNKKTLTSFYGKKLAIVKGYYMADYLRDNHPQISLYIVNNRQEGLIALQQGQAEGLVETISSASQLLKQESLINLAISVIEGMPSDQSHLGVQKNNVLLKDILDKGLASISSQERNVIHEKWFSIDINTGLDKAMVMRVALQVALLIFAILIIILMWNRRLKAEVKHRKQLEEKMKYMATHDDLTGLANRVLLKDRINTAIEIHQRQSLLLAVLFLDLDGFKTVNDTYGHDVGDELLLLVAKRLQACVRKSDTVVRFGGDEFVLLLTGLHHHNEASFVAEKVLKLLQQPFELSSTTVAIGCSIGIAMYPGDGTNDTDLLKEADTLMYQVKAAGKNHYLFNENNHSVLG